MKNQRKFVFVFVDVLVVVVVVVVDVDAVFVVLLVIIVLVFAGLGAVAEGGAQFWFVCGLFSARSKARSNRTEHNSFV